MSKRTHKFALLSMVLLSFPCLGAGKKPTEPTETCSTRECHNSYRQKRFVHEPVARGVCKLCHRLIDPKKHSFQLVRTRKELCGGCHQEQAKGKYLHQPVEQGKCVDCHNPHASDYKFLVPTAKISELCRKCHDKKEDVKNPHAPVAEGKCTQCHSNHSSSYRPLLINNKRQLCFSCHSADLVLVKENENLTEFRNGKTNLHYVHVNSPERGRTCRACHATHASNEPKHLRKAIPYGGWEIPLQFEKTETGGGCSPGCHNARAYDRMTPVVYMSDKK